MSLHVQCGASVAFLCGEDRLVGRRGRLCLSWPPRLAAKTWWAMSGLSPAVAIPGRPRVGNATAVCSIYVDPSDGKGCVNAVARPCREGIYDDDKEASRKRCDERSRGRAPVSSEKIDEWMEECIKEIVRNIGEAPFLVHVFSNDEALKLEMEPADPENWRVIRSRWNRGVATPPDGVILVEELKGQKRDGGRATITWDDEDDARFGASGSKTWGIVVQGWGADCAACYILSTCRVRSAFGFCTHFCLTRATCFEDTAEEQLKRSWLVGSRDANGPNTGRI